MELEHAVPYDQDDIDDRDDARQERRRPRAGIALAAGAFVGIAAAMVVAATTNNAFAAVVVMGVAVLAALGSVLSLE